MSLFSDIWNIFVHHNAVPALPATKTGVQIFNQNPLITLTPEMLRQIVPNMAIKLSEDAVDAINAHASNYSFTNPMLPMFLAQTLWESANYTKLQEDLYYTTPKALMAAFPTHFATVSSCTPYLRNPEKLGNFVYANRLGNGDEASGDGYNCRGLGLIQLTGRENQEKFANYIDQTLENAQKYLITIEGGVEGAMYFWQEHNLGRFITHDQVDDCTKIINGGLAGLANRTSLFDKADKIV